ncbi:hypothetical protein NA66_100854 [Burkholderia pyrrocinia]|uniref:Uncharacterized protein n=1 Tax=Burkholderia pyrrocinia TaxID=60550 RepID=A0A318IQ11_BURPY|nr:hypothetical protein NA66_100854 [Burkholderia pyrrocinia]SFW68882.1 hypothetical protein SAMN03159384_03861 [Burkholderia sp. NFACC33-1]SFY32033.1 hypothetical protein SAMN03159408_04171 [Burkholderia sp. NFPP32]
MVRACAIYADIAAGTHLYRYFELDVARPSIPHGEAWYERLKARPAYRTHVMIPFDELRGRLDYQVAGRHWSRLLEGCKNNGVFSDRYAHRMHAHRRDDSRPGTGHRGPTTQAM